MAKQVLVPPLGTTVDTVILVSWYKAEGEAIRKGEPLFVIETDKANLDVESPASGILRSVNAVAGDELKALTVIAYIAEADETVATVEQQKPTVETKLATVLAKPESLEAAKHTGERVFISPRARRLAEENHIAISLLKATGPEGAIIERDVRQYLASQATSAAPGIPVSPAAVVASAQQLVGSRAEVAASMLQSESSLSHFSLAAEADITQLVAWRSKLNETNIKPSYNSLILFTISRVLKANPHLIPMPSEEMSTPSRQIDIGLAVAGVTKFLFPVVQNISQKGLTQLAAEERDLTALSTTGKLEARKDEACAMRLVNLGEYGIDTFTPWFYTPGYTVLCIGRVREQRDILDGKVNTRQVIWLSLTADQQQTDGLQAALFMQAVVRHLENPILLLGV